MNKYSRFLEINPRKEQEHGYRYTLKINNEDYTAIYYGARIVDVQCDKADKNPSHDDGYYCTIKFKTIEPPEVNNHLRTQRW